MSPMRVAGTRIFIAKAFCVMPRGRRNSSRSISPGCVVTLCIFHPVAGLLIVIFILQSVVIGDLYIVRSIVLPDKADAVLIVDPYAVLATSIALQSLQSISRRSTQIVERT